MTDSSEKKVVKVPRRKVISGKRYIEHKKFLQKINRRLKAKGEPPLKGKKPTGKSKTVPEVPKTRFPRSYVVQQGKAKMSLRKRKCFSKHVKHIRASLKPGAVLILLAGPHKGKRVVFLKALKSGMLLVTGPFKFNGVPLRRVNQCYVIATSTQVDISGVEIPKRINDEYFRRMDLKETKTDTDKLFSLETKKYSVSDERKEDQKIVDKQVRDAMKKHPESKLLHAYLRSLFSLGKRDYPHRMSLMASKNGALSSTKCTQFCNAYPVVKK